MSAVELEQPMDVNAFCSCDSSFHLMFEQYKSVGCLPFSPQLQEPRFLHLHSHFVIWF